MASQSKVYEIIQKQVPALLLDGYLTDVMDEDTGRFYACTFNHINQGTYENYDYPHRELAAGGYGSWGVDDEKSRIYVDAEKTRYSYKSREQRIEEGVFTSFAVKFYGCLYENQWYILKELAYFGELLNEEQAKGLILQNVEDRSILKAGIYLPITSHFPAYGEATATPRGVQYLEFIGMPELVAYQLEEKKQALGRAFQQFFNLDVFIPFTEQLRRHNFEEYTAIIPLYSASFNMIYPAPREYILIPAMVCNIHGKYRLCYFFWHAANRKMYQWTYFSSTPTDFGYHYAQDVINDLSTISSWNDPSYLSYYCTLDDMYFWQTYVLDEKYLVEMPR